MKVSRAIPSAQTSSADKGIHGDGEQASMNSQIVIVARMKKPSVLAVVFSLLAAAVFAQVTTYDADLAKKLGADERGMRMFVLCILKTGPKDAEIKGDARKEIFKGHFENIGRLANEGKLAIAGPFGKNDKSYRGLYIFNVATIEEAQKLVELDPAVKAGVFVPDLTPWYGTAAVLVVNDTHKKIEKPRGLVRSRSRGLATARPRRGIDLDTPEV